MHDVLAVCIVLCAVLVVATLALAPGNAYATYADVADSYGTVEELEPKTDPIYAEDIPDGTYSNIKVRTSSSFCKVSNCTLKKDGDALVAAFTLSTSYTAIYLGTADDAAAETDEAGDDDSAYFLAKSVKISNSTFSQFTIPLSAVSDPLYIATFNGGSQSHTKACWYDRSFIFDASDALILAVQSGTAPDDEETPGSDEETDDKNKAADEKTDDKKASDEKADDENAKANDAQGEDDEKADDEKKAAKPAATKTQDKKPAENKKPKAKAEAKKKKEPAKKDAKSAAAASKKPSSPSSSKPSGSAGSENSQKNKPGDEASSDGGAQQDAKKATIPGVPMSFVSADLVPDELDTAAAAAEKDAGKGWALDPMMLLALAVFCALVLVGVALRVVLFKHAGGTLGRI